jgi:glutathione S-transferase
MSLMKLYDLEISGNCYKIRLFLSLLELPYECVPIDTKARENKTEAFLRLHPLGQLPVLEDGDHVLWDSTSILVYLARKYGGAAWNPESPREAADDARWLAISQQGDMTALARARAVHLFGTPGDPAGLQRSGARFLEFVEGHLRSRSWLALERPSLADVACYPYIALAPDGGISLAKYEAVQAWLERMRRLPGYVALPEPTPENIARSSGPTAPGRAR